MPFRYRKYSLPLLLLFILLTSHSALPITVRRQLKDAKSILTSPGFLRTRSFFDVLRDSLLSSSSSFSNHRDENGGTIRRYTSKSRNAKPIASYRQSDGDGNFVIFASSPGKSGFTLTNVAAQTDESEGQVPLAESNNDTPAPSIESEVSIEGIRSTTSSSDFVINSNDNGNTTNADVPGSNSSAASNLPPTPEADVFLNISTDPGSSQNNSSTTITGPQAASDDDTIHVDLSVIGPSTEELLAFDPEAASPEDGGDGIIPFEISADHIPQPSETPDPLEDAGVILAPPDTDDVFNTPDVNVDVDFPDISSDPASTESYESPDIAEATSQSVSTQPDISADGSSVEERESAIATPETSQAESFTEPNVLVDFPLSFSSSRESLGPEFDRHSREFLGETTNTTADQWKPTEVSGTVRTIQRQQGSRWEITYQGELTESTAQRSVETLERNINEGAMDSFLTDRLSAPVTVRTASPPSLNAPPRKEVRVTGPVLKETASGDETTSPEGESGRSLGLILGTCFGLLGALVLGGTAFVVLRRSGRNEEPHVLDGVATAPTTIMTFESDRTESESRFNTGAPTKPRGPNVLRNQSRILDWQMDHATATGKAKHILGRENNENEVEQVTSTSDEGDVSTAKVLV